MTNNTLRPAAPIGERSFSPWTFTPGVSDKSLYSDDGFNMGTSNRHIILIAQVESVKGIANVEEIAAVEGVSALMLGPGDFSADAGIPLRLGGEPVSNIRCSLLPPVQHDFLPLYSRCALFLAYWPKGAPKFAL